MGNARHRKKGSTTIPAPFENWFAQRGWRLLPHQHAMIDRFQAGVSTLLVAPTGCGKTLAGFLPSLIDISRSPSKGLHTLYVSPLKALTYDILRNLDAPIADMGLPVRVEARTGDTPSHRRVRQRRDPPHILLTTPESLMLMLSYPEAPQMFASLKAIVIDEVHSFAASKRGDMLSLCMAQLSEYAPQLLRFGLSATVADKQSYCDWLGPTGSPVTLLEAEVGRPPHVRLMETEMNVPYTGFMGKYAVDEIYAAIRGAGTTLVFVNTRAQAELLFRFLWDVNEENLPIALYHGSLNREQRHKTENMMAEGKLRAVIATSALELGIDWGDVDLVIQLGAPKGVSRLLQRIGRSNHRIGEPSEALLVPSNRFEILECEAAIEAIEAGALDGEAPEQGAEDVVCQFIMNAACSKPVFPEDLHRLIKSAWGYRNIGYERFISLLQFVEDGGYVLRAYERHKRLMKNPQGAYQAATDAVIRRHRQNIGVIVEAARLKVRKISGRGRGRILGEVEEAFAQGLTPGDTFFFAGEVLAFVGVRDMFLEARASPANEPKIPSYMGGNMPLSTFLADSLRCLLEEPDLFRRLPAEMEEWLDLQKRYSIMPGPNSLLIESFPRQKFFFLVFYTFEGRKANQTLGMLVTRRMERRNLKPLSFTITDYGLAIASLEQVEESHITYLTDPDILSQELEEWMEESPMLKRSFRRVAIISGLTEQNYVGTRKTMKQVTFSTDLIYDVLRRYEPNHVLLALTRADAERELLDTARLADMLIAFQDRIAFRKLKRPSPFSIPILLDVRTERVHGGAMEVLLAQASQEIQAQKMMDEVRAELA